MALRTEIQTLEKLTHPRIVQYYGSQSYENGSLAIFMEYMPGVSELLFSVCFVFCCNLRFHCFYTVGNFCALVETLNDYQAMARYSFYRCNFCNCVMFV